MNHACPSLRKITPDQLTCMDLFAGDCPLSITLAYARDDNLLFGERIYRKDAQLWLYQDLADIILKAAQIIYKNTGGSLVLYDGLRTTDAQAAMLKTKRVKENPHWLEEPRLLSPPGAGGHPRGMAVDVSIINSNGVLLDMGTEFDFLAHDPSPSHNPAHRDYQHNEQVSNNRRILDDAMMGAAADLGVPLFPLPQEWWDYRLPQEFYKKYAPLSDQDMPPHIRLMN